MSRDFTPREVLIMEKHTKISVFDFMSTTVIQYNGKEEPLYTSEAIALRKQFPLFGKLINRFELLYNPLSEVNGGIEFLKEKEKELKVYIEAEKGDLKSYLVRWFDGELDPNFYYSERNEELFVEKVIEEAKKRKL